MKKLWFFFIFLLILGYSNIAFASAPKILGCEDFQDRVNKSIELLKEKDTNSYNRLLVVRSIEENVGNYLAAATENKIYINYPILQLFSSRNGYYFLTTLLSHEAVHLNIELKSEKEEELIAIAQTIETAKLIGAPKSIINYWEKYFKTILDK